MHIKDTLNIAASRELADLLFSYPYIKIKVLEDHHIAARETASKYLHKLVDTGWLHTAKKGRDIYFINHQLMQILIL